MFDGNECSNDLDECYKTKMWSEIEDEFKEKLKEELKNSLKSMRKEVKIAG